MEYHQYSLHPPLILSSSCSSSLCLTQW
ncbi:Protein of unknown function [Pyronema omphalodes CBS 100304]|uniref:Uncharacterized protein n=1 Tax=Pyronema omphalodes (strain CBS 100304) TaxID=1076935 RepID=U4LRI8_PYROM|nr:Protein of unknown function [Pyronema omphalodes CBS 100304]